MLEDLLAGLASYPCPFISICRAVSCNGSAHLLQDRISFACLNCIINPLFHLMHQPLQCSIQHPVNESTSYDLIYDIIARPYSYIYFCAFGDNELRWTLF